MKRNRFFAIVIVILLLLSACDSSEKNTGEEKKADFISQAGGGDALKIVAGSENKVLEPILEDYAKKSGKKVQMFYLGSLDIMRLLSSEEIEYDAVWPASSIWLTMGDSNRVLKHKKTTSITPVVFGIKESLAKKLGFVGRTDIKLKEIIGAIERGDLKFAMTSATQSNSGASSYLAFLTALSKDPNAGLSSKDLQDPTLQKEIKSLLSGVNRSSGSSNWLVDLFLMGDYDAMVNYEQLIIQTNMELEKQGKEPLYAVYPVDGLSLSDSPLAYIDKDDEKKEKDFIELQDYLLSEEAQKKIEQTGKRNAFFEISPENKDIYKEEWGIRTESDLPVVRLPKAEVISEALTMYQTSFKKPAYTIYVLDYSYSMQGKGKEQMISALEQVMLPENASRNLLQGTDLDRTYILPFDSNPREESKKDGSNLTDLFKIAEVTNLGGGTGLYEAAARALEIASKETKLSNYSPAIVLLTDGDANGSMGINDLDEYFRATNIDIPIFSIKFGDAVDAELEAIAKLTNARVFDGRKDLIKAFQSVKGYN